ncbi:MAG: hypothetical protein KA715_00325 [Xanthomonadaceae bacterium]|nr:hypothetical protein [Xanthomonadaceae bacterium]
MKTELKTKGLEVIMRAYVDYRVQDGKAPLILYSELLVDLLNSSGVSITDISFSEFVRRTGISNPKLEHLSSFYVGRYLEFLIHYRGIRDSRKRLIPLRLFWEWCKEVELIDKSEKLPPDLKNIEDEVNVQIFGKYKITIKK